MMALSILALVNQFSCFSLNSLVLTCPNNIPSKQIGQVLFLPLSLTLWVLEIPLHSLPSLPGISRKGHDFSFLMSVSSNQGWTLTNSHPYKESKMFLSLLILSFILGMFCCIWADAAGYVLALQTPCLLDVDHGASSSLEPHRLLFC